MPTAQKTQHAVQLTAPGELRINESKEIPAPGPFQILAKVEAVGLCFSDLKVLKQFSEHVRKSDVVSGLEAKELAGIPSYVPGDQPTVLGHEIVVTVSEVGDKVTHYKPGDRLLVQPDLRSLRTAASNAAIGYNFEGGLQRYMLLDERVMIAPSGEEYLLPVADHLGSSQAALVEPWACVEDSYVTEERQTIKAGGKLIVVADEGHEIKGLEASSSPEGKPEKIFARVAEESQRAALDQLGVPVETFDDPNSLAEKAYDDVVYFGARKETLEGLNDRLAKRSILNVVTNGKRIDGAVSVGVGWMHYGPTRWVGTFGDDASEGYQLIPKNGEVRDGDSIFVLGAGGPMGQMHVIRNICSGRKGLSVVAADLDDARLASLEQKGKPMAEANNVSFRTINPKREEPGEKFSYFAIMAPVGQLVADALRDSKPGAIVNIFAGVPAPVRHELDLNEMIEKKVFLYGTSGSSIEDIRIVLGKVTEGSLNTNSSVDAISGLAGAIEGIHAVENRTMAGKIIVYPQLEDTGLIPLSELDKHFPQAAAKLENGQWCKAAEEELLRSDAAKN